MESAVGSRATAPQRSAEREVSARPPKVLFVGSEYAGHRTRFLSLRAYARNDPSIRPTFRGVTGWKEGGLPERLPLGRAISGRLRALIETSSLARLPRPDAIWMSVAREALPHIAVQTGPLRRPVVMDLDWTLEQQEELAPVYYARRPKSGLLMSIARTMEKVVWRQVTIFSPWSKWAAASLQRQGVSSDRIRINPPGVDLGRFRPSARSSDSARPLRLLFIGGDFERKGGDLLLQAVEGDLAGRVELDIVTRDDVKSGGAIRVHRAEANSPLLERLLAQADVYVMPSKAECFGISTVEAMASGLPSIIGDVGAGREIVDHGITGWLVEPTVQNVASALRAVLERRDDLPAMGRRAREVAEQRFDGSSNDARVVQTIFEAIEIEVAGARMRNRGRQQ